MHCPICKHVESFVVKTEAEEVSIRRRRQCTRCGHRWTTFESMADVCDELTRLRQALAPIAELVR
jgi:transcriptional repressor NrdR